MKKTKKTTKKQKLGRGDNDRPVDEHCVGCGKRGIYFGCQQVGGDFMLVAFRCGCGEAWGFNAHKSEVEKYRGLV